MKAYQHKPQHDVDAAGRCEWLLLDLVPANVDVPPHDDWETWRATLNKEPFPQTKASHLKLVTTGRTLVALGLLLALSTLPGRAAVDKPSRPAIRCAIAGDAASAPCSGWYPMGTHSGPSVVIKDIKPLHRMSSMPPQERRFGPSEEKSARPPRNTKVAWR